MSGEGRKVIMSELAELARKAGMEARRRNPRGSRVRLDADLESGEGFNEPTRKAGAQEMWAIYNGRMYAACETAVDVLPPGQYTIEFSQQIGLYFHKTDVNLDELIHLPDSVSEEVVEEIRAFWTKEEHFRKLGFLWKRGVLLWGPPGSGKTSTIQVISQEIINNGGMSIYINDPEVAAKGLKTLRSVEPHRPIVVMLEDVDAIVEQHGESELLALMDGELQIDNVVFVACLAPHHRVLTKDLRWVEAGNVKAGDELWTFDEHQLQASSRRGSARRYRKGQVISSFLAQKECIAVQLESGEEIICTTDHPWLATDALSHTRRWVQAKDLLDFPLVCRPFQPWKTDLSWEAGWLAGMMDGEGHVRKGYKGMAHNIGIAQRVGPTLDQLLSATSKFGNIEVQYAYQDHPKWKPVGHIRFNGSMQEAAALIGRVRANRLIENFDLSGGVVQGPYERVVSITPIGVRDVQSIETDTHTYFGEGFAMHNTTNYPERLDARFVCRPSRFDLVRKIPMPSPEARRTYLTAKNPRLTTPEAEVELQRWIKETNKFSIAHLKELIVSVEVFGVPFEEAVSRLRALVDSLPKSSDSDFKRAFGFNSTN